MDSTPSVPGVTCVKGEPLLTQDIPVKAEVKAEVKSEVKTEFKREELEEHLHKESRQHFTDGPCTKMTMRLRRNLNNMQSVSNQRKIHQWKSTIMIDSKDRDKFERNLLKTTAPNWVLVQSSIETCSNQNTEQKTSLQIMLYEMS